jgi:hypothetical protein
LRFFQFLSLFWIAGVYCPAVRAQEKPRAGFNTLSFHFANDLFAASDRGFTGGLKFNWLHKVRTERGLESWLRWIPLPQVPSLQKAFSLSLGQHMYTPKDLSRSDLIEEDRPYAGVAYLSLGIYGQSSDYQDFMELTAGLVGPGAGGEASQRLIHRTVGNSHPRGWRHQLKNEPVFAWVWERKCLR